MISSEARPRGRPATFVREEAVERAMRAFWWHGYDGTGMHALLDTMGIGRQSLYNTFGSKLQLYAAALEWYERTRLTYIVDLLAEGGSAGDLLTAALRRWAHVAAPAPRPGCLLANTLASDLCAEAIVADLTQKQLARLRTAFGAVLADGTQAGEVRLDVEVDPAADHLVTLGLGLALRARAGAPSEDLEAILRAGLSPMLAATALPSEVPSGP